MLTLAHHTVTYLEDDEICQKSDESLQEKIHID